MKIVRDYMAVTAAEGESMTGGDALFRKIGAYLAPNDEPPTRLGQ